MENDLSLAQTLGGLRIANPDKFEPSSPMDETPDRPSTIFPQTSPSSSTASTPTEQPQQSNRRSRLFAPFRRRSSNRTPSPLDAKADVAAKPATASPVVAAPSERQQYVNGARDARAMPLNHQAQQELQDRVRSPAMAVPYQNPASRSASGPSSRPVSMLSQTSPSVVIPAGKASTYRLRSESSRSSMSGPSTRSESRSSSSTIQAGVPTFDEGHCERIYRQGSQKSGVNGPIPPRRTSNVMADGAMNGAASPHRAPSSGSPYLVEGGPLPSSEEWKDRGAAMGIQRELDRDGRPVSKFVKKGVKDFNFGRTLGEGSYSTVMAATDRQTLREYAIKVLDKRHIIKEKKVKYVSIEKDTLNRLTEHPGIVRLYYTFQDERSLYFVLDLASAGELLGWLKKMTTFDEECTRFYGAQILDAVDYMHSRGVIHRDLKPENVLLDDDMHVKITDFGTAKILDSPSPDHRERANSGSGGNGSPPGNPLDDDMDDGRTKSFVGTAEYVSPELLSSKDVGPASDLWAFGCIIYQLLAGRPPFKAANEYQTFQKILGLEYEFPPGFPRAAKDLVERLLVLDPGNRLSLEHVKNHEFFAGVVWGPGLWKQKAPRLKSYVASPTQEPNVIKLNGQATNASQQSLPRPYVQNRTSNGALRPHPRVITELPPPSQLDIEWSPVLTSTNERILKLGNLMVQSAPAPHSPRAKGITSNGDGATETPKKFSRFFGGSGTKKRQRLVMVTSSARIIMAAAGGEEKKTKMEVSLLSPSCGWRSMKDAKGATMWCVDTKDKQYIFEDLKPSSSNDANGTSGSAAQEWLETMERAKAMAMVVCRNMSNGTDESLPDLPSMSTTTTSLERGTELLEAPTRLLLLPLPGSNGTQTNGEVVEQQLAAVPSKARKRFSKRHSKNGLSAVF